MKTSNEGRYVLFGLGNLTTSLRMCNACTKWLEWESGMFSKTEWLGEFKEDAAKAMKAIRALSGEDIEGVAWYTHYKRNDVGS